MGISSNVLWHQTRKDAFFEILKSKKLCVSYSQEEVMPRLRVAFPMVCLCDLPLSEFASNNWTYGINNHIIPVVNLNNIIFGHSVEEKCGMEVNYCGGRL